MTTPEYVKGNLYQLDPKELKTDPNQPRKYFDSAALEDLVNSIQAQGVLQPILFRVDDKGDRFVVAGERRFRAAQKAGLKEIPAIFADGNPDEIALMENLLREDLTAMEHAEALNRMIEVHKYTHKQLGIFIRKAKSTISEILSLNHLPDRIKNECRKDANISRKTLISIAKKKKAERIEAAYEKYKAKSASSTGKRGPKGKRKSVVERIASRYDALTAYVTDVDFKLLDTDARTDLISRIEEWKSAVDEIIESIKNAPEYEPPPKKEPKPKKVKAEKKKPSDAKKSAPKR